MAFEADCGLSTVLEETRVTSKSGSTVPGEWRATCDTLESVHHRDRLGHGVAQRAKPERRV